MRAETVIVVVLVLVTAGAFALEAVGPDAARIVGITFCLLLLSAVVAGMVARARVKRRRAPEEERDAFGPEASPEDRQEPAEDRAAT